MNRGRIGIFGGTFDPPHLGHLRVASSALEILDLNKVLWIPASQSPFKRDNLSSTTAARFEMTRLSIADQKEFELSEIELDRGGVSYTVDTLEALRPLYPDSELFLILGEDSWASFPQWRNPYRIVDLACPVVYPRNRHQDVVERGPSPGEFEHHRLDIPEVEISSTDIRKRVSEARPYQHLVTPAVAEFIREQQLYRS